MLVDSPRFAKPLVKNMDAMGGVRRMLLTHQDDVADHEKFTSHFTCERVLHRDDVRSRTAAVEQQPAGRDPVELDHHLLMIPTPGHTRGHAVYLYRDDRPGVCARGRRSAICKPRFAIAGYPAGDMLIAFARSAGA